MRILRILMFCVLFLLEDMALAQKPVTLYACVLNSQTDRTIRMVSASTVCAATEHKIFWDQTGPVGPQGIQGATGPQGTPGVSMGNSNFGSNWNPPLILGPSDTPTIVLVAPAVITSGDYYVNSIALLEIAANDGAYCYNKAAHESGFGMQGGSSAGMLGQRIFQQASMTDDIYLTAGDHVQLLCYSANNTNQSSVFNASITAIYIDDPQICPPCAKHKAKGKAPVQQVPGGPVSR